MSEGDVEDIEYLQSAVDVFMPASDSRLLKPFNSALARCWILQLVISIVSAICFYSLIFS